MLFYHFPFYKNPYTVIAYISKIISFRYKIPKCFIYRFFYEFQVHRLCIDQSLCSYYLNKEEWQAHFERLLGSDEQTGEESRQSKRVEEDEEGEDDEVEGELKELNKEIELSEMIKVMRYMKKRKAPGKMGYDWSF